MLTERLCCALRLVEVTTSQPQPRKTELTRNPCRTYSAIPIQNHSLHPVYRPADGQASACSERFRQRRNGGFCRTIHVDQAELTCPTLRNRRRASLPAKPHRFHGRQWALRQCREQRCGEDHLCGFGAFDLVQQALAGVGPEQARTVNQRHQRAHVARIERQRHAVQHSITRSDIEPPTMIEQQVDQRSMFDHHALRHAGRTGGVNHLSKLLRVMLERRRGWRLRIQLRLGSLAGQIHPTLGRLQLEWR